MLVCEGRSSRSTSTGRAARRDALPIVYEPSLRLALYLALLARRPRPSPPALAPPQVHLTLPRSSRPLLFLRSSSSSSAPSSLGSAGAGGLSIWCDGHRERKRAIERARMMDSIESSVERRERCECRAKVTARWSGSGRRGRRGGSGRGRGRGRGEGEEEGRGRIGVRTGSSLDRKQKGRRDAPAPRARPDVPYRAPSSLRSGPSPRPTPARPACPAPPLLRARGRSTR